MNTGKKSNTGIMVICSYFISCKAFDNLITLVSGFLSYAEPILMISDNDEFISALHCNQSSMQGFVYASEQC